MIRVVVLVSLVGCIESAAVVCSDGTVCPATDQCDTAHGGCVTQEQLDACAAFDNGTSCTTTVTGDGVCDANVCLPVRCGDGYRAPEEICDGGAFATVSNCNQVGFYEDKQLGCKASCELDTSMCSERCGDGIRNGEEVCDGDLPDASCVDYGYGAGAIACSVNCGPELSACIPFGWRSVAMPEAVRHVAGTSATNVWVVGDNKMVQRFDGATWHPIDASCAQANLVWVHPLSETDAFMIDDTGLGQTAVVQISAAGCTRSAPTGMPLLHSVWASSLTDAYAGSDPDAGLWHFDGTSWTQAHAVKARWVWGSGPSDVYSGTVFGGTLQHYDGVTWQPVVVPGIANVFGLWGTGVGDVYVAGVDASDHAVIAHGSPGTWSTVLSDLPVLGNTATSRARTGSTLGTHTFVEATSSAQVPHLLMSDGTGWVSLDAPVPAAGASTYAAPDSRVYLAPRGEHHVFVFDGATRVSSDLVPTTTSLRNIYAAGAGEVLALALAPSNALYAWDGAAWTTDATSVNDAARDDAGNLYVASLSTGVALRLPGGTYQPLVGDASVLVGATSPTDVWFKRTAAATNIVTHYNGADGRDDTLPISGVTKLLAVTPNLAFAFTLDEGVARYADGTWSAIASPFSGVYDAYAASATDAYAWVPSAIMHYDGTAWTLLPSPPPERFIRAVWGDSSALFVAGDDGLHFFDGSRWTPVDIGAPLGATALSARGDSLFVATQSRVRQIVRTRSW